MKKPNFNLTPEELQIEAEFEDGESIPITAEMRTEQIAIGKYTNELRKLMNNKSKKYNNLTEMLADITPDNIHPATDWGPDVGAEIIK